MDHHSVPDNADAGVAGHLTIDNHKSANRTNLGYLEGFADNGFSDNLFLVFWIQHSLHGIFHLFDNLVDDAMQADFDLICICLLTSNWGRTNVKADDEGIGCLCQSHIRFVDGTNGCMDDSDFHAFHFNFLKGRGKGFNRTLYIGLDNNIDRLDFACFESIKEVFKADTLSGLTLFKKGALSPFFTRCTRRFLIFVDGKVVSCHRCFVETCDRNRCRWSSNLDTTAQIIGHSTNPTKSITNNDWILNIKGTLLHQKSGNRTFPFVQMCLDNGTDGSNSWVRLEFLNFSYQENRLQQFINVLVEFG